MGGGLLETNNQLERFTKNKRNKKIIYSILGILLVIGSITLYKTFAFYEEKKSFNVLKGRIPDFGYDIKLLSVVIDDKKSETIPERGLYKTNVHCTNGTFGEWDYNNWNLVLNNVSSESKCNVEFTSGLSEDEYNKYIEAGKALHRNTYRGKDITSYYTDGSLYTRIANGSFEDLYVGDYINANDVTWLIADIDNYLHSGDSGHTLMQHHLTIVPAYPIDWIGINNISSTSGGYYNSILVQSKFPEYLSQEGIIGKAFGNHLIEYRNFLSIEGFDENGELSCEWKTRKIDLMSEVNVYGTIQMTHSICDIGVDNQQYALFQLKPDTINYYGRSIISYWVRTIINDKKFGRVDDSRILGTFYAEGAAGVRPRFLIG